MNYLGVDWGRAKIGLAISEGVLAQPWRVVAANRAVEEILKTHPDVVVVGVSENISAKGAKSWGKALQARGAFEVVFVDETLSTWEARELSRLAGIGPGKRKTKEDAYAAAIILQRYLDEIT